MKKNKYKETISRISEMHIECPECFDIEDEQYCCTYCQSGGELYFLDWVKKNMKLILARRDMNEFTTEVERMFRDELKHIDCPECEWKSEDDHSKCEVCGSVDGWGRLDVYKWVMNNIHLFREVD